MPPRAGNSRRRRDGVGHNGPVEAERSVWVVSAAIEATEDEAHAAAEVIGLALCPAPDHEGYCKVPWTTMMVQFKDLDLDEQASWQEVFDEQRMAAREAGEPGA